MDAREIQQLAEDVKCALNGALAIKNNQEFMHRVMVQAVLTAGGELRVDPALADQAKTERRKLEFGAGGVRLVD